MISLPNQLELQTLFSGFLFEAGLSAVSVKNYLSDLRHFFSFCASVSSQDNPPTVQEIFQRLSKYITLYLDEQKRSFTPINTTNRRSASIRRFSTFLESKFGLVSDSVVTKEAQNNTLSTSNTSSLPNDNSLPTLNKILDQFKGFLQKEKKTHSTVKNYVSDLNHFFAWSASETPFLDQNLENILSESHLNTYVTYLKLSHISTSVINRRQSSVKQFTKYCFLQKYIPTNPFEYKRETPRLLPLSWFERFSSSKANKEKKGSRSLLGLWYQKYNSLPFTPYLHLAILALASSAMVIFGYNQIIKQATPSSAALPTVPRRQLSFQGRLTDSSATPITTSVNVTFKLWNDPTAGSQLYTSNACTIVPDGNGIFNTLIGNGTCGQEIASTVFTENRDVYLEVIVGSETLTPRQQIATVGYALNSETLQGYPASASATINTVPIVDNNGDINIAAASPNINSTSGTFTLSGQALTLSTATNSGGDIVLQPDSIGGGNVQILGGTTDTDTLRIENANITSGALISGYIGNNTATGRLLSLTAGSTETDRFYVAASGQTKINTSATLDNAGMIVNQNGTGDLFTASASGVTKLTLANNGNISATGTLTGLTGLTVASGTVSLPNGEINNAEISELDWTKLQNYPSACPAGQAIQAVGDTLTCVDISVASGNLWQRTSGSVAPINITDSLNLGSTATNSALVHLAGTVAENSWVNTGNFGIGDTSPAATLTVGSGDKFQVAGATGNITTSGTLTLPNSNTLTGVANYVRLSQGLSVGGADTYYFNSAGTINANAGTFAGTLDANGNVSIADTDVAFDGATTTLTSTGAFTLTPGGAFTLGATTQSLVLRGTTVGITSNSAGNDITLTSADQIILNSTGTIELQDATNVTGALAGSTTITAGTTLTAGLVATYDPITISPIVKGVNAYTGTVTSLDLTAARTWTLPDATGTIALTSDITSNNLWQLNAGTVTPTNITNALTLGSTASPSAIVSLPGTTNKDGFFNFGTGNFGIGDTSPAATLTVGSGDKFQVAGATGNITTAGTLAVNGDSITSDGDLTIDAAGGDVLLGASDNLKLTAATNLFLDADTTLGDVASAIDSGAYMVGVFDEFAYSNGANVQDVLDDLDAAISTVSGNNYWQLNLGTVTPANITNALTLGNTASASAIVSLPGTTNKDGFFNFGTGNFGIGTTTPVSKLDVVSDQTSGNIFSVGLGMQTITGALNALFINPGPLTPGGNSITGIKINNYTGGNSSAINTSIDVGTVSGAGTENYGMYLHTVSGATSNYSLRISGTAAASNNYAIFSDALAKSYFAGDIGIGTTTPTAKLDIVGSASSSGTFAFRGTTDPKIDILNGENLGFRTSPGGDAGLTEKLTLLNNGNFGIGDTSPAAMLTVGSGDLFQINSSGIISNIDGVAHTIDDVSGNLSLTSNSANVSIADNLIPTLDLTYYLGSGTMTWNGAYLGSIYDSGGVETISISNKQLVNGDWKVAAGLRIGNTGPVPSGYKLWVDGNASVSGTLSVDTPLVDGTADITVGGGAGKIDVGMVDPPYTINGSKYATYMASMIGAKEETVGKITTSEDSYIPGLGYRTLIDLDQQEIGSNLWLFSQTTNIQSHINDLSVLLTPEGQAKAWYEVDTANKILAIYSSTPTNITFRLSAPRFDAYKWTNVRQSKSVGLVINDSNIYSNTNSIFDNPVVSPELIAKIDGSYSLKINGVENKEVASFMKGIIANLQAGAAVVANLVTENLETSNLVVKTKLVSPLADIDQINAINATISGTLYANDIKGQTVDNLKTKINLLDEKYSTASAILADLQAQYSTYNSLFGATSSAVVSGDPLSLSPLAETTPLIPSDLALNSLNVHTLIANDLMTNGAIFTNSISAFDTDLYIQLGEKPVHILADLMVLYPNGTVKINGDLLVTGNILAKGLDSETATVSGNIAVGSSTISTESAKFAQLTTNGLIIASGNENASGSGSTQINSNATIGVATIAAGTGEIAILNTKVTPTTLIYITPTSDTQGRVLFVKSKNEGVGFTVAITGNSNNPTVSFNYWLVETK